MDTFDDRLILYDIDKVENSPLPSSVAFQISISIKNATVQRCIIDRGSPTHVIVNSVWKQHGSTNLSPSTISLHSWDGHPLQPLYLYHNYTIAIFGKIVLIYIEVIDAPLDYNISLGRSYTYAISFVNPLSLTRCALPTMEISSPSII